eukprot:3196030-Pyramimonas_sp.AAC.1
MKWPLEQDFGAERHRDKERVDATDQVREAQRQCVPNLGPIALQKERSPYRQYRPEFDDIWPWLQGKGVRPTRINPLHNDEASDTSK